MKQSVNSYDFHRAFEQLRPDNFSYMGLEVLFDYFEQLEDDMGEEIELDVIAICCDYSEMSMGEVVSNYICSGTTVYESDLWEEIQEVDSEEEKDELVIEWLQDRTQVITVGDDTVIIQAF